MGVVKHVVIVGEGDGKMKEKLRELFRAVEVGKDMLFDEPQPEEEEKEFQRFMEMHRMVCEELEIATAKTEEEITATEMVTAIERMRELCIKPVDTLNLQQLTQEQIEKLIDRGFLPAYKPVFEPRIIPYDPPPYKSFYDEYRMEAMLGRFERGEAFVIRNLKICPVCGCPMQGVNVCPDCGNKETEENADAEMAETSVLQT